MKKPNMVTMILVTIAIVVPLLFVVEPILQSIPHHFIIPGDTADAIMNNAAAKYGNFSESIGWWVHVSANGKIHAIDGTGKFYRYGEFSCLFPIIPNDGKDHFASLMLFRNSDTAYVVVMDDQTGQIIESKPVSLGSAACGP
jgi:hypothetical protein